MILNHAADVQAGSDPASFVYLGNQLVWQRLLYDETKFSIVLLDGETPVRVEYTFPAEAASGCKSYLSSMQRVFPNNRYYLHIGNQMGLTEIPFEFVRECDNLSAVSVPEGVTTIGDSSFYGCDALHRVVLPGSLRMIENGAFSETPNLTGVTIPYGVTSIRQNAFSSSGLLSVSIPDSVTELGNISLVSGAVFRDCTSLETVTLPSGIQYLYDNMFYGCISLNSVILPENLTGIGDYAFYNCTSLQSIEIPGSVREIVGYAEGAFLGCDALTEIIVHKPQDSIDDAPWGAPNAVVTWTG